MTIPLRELHPQTIEPDVARLLEQFSNLICEVVNFGTHIIKWDLDEVSGKDENIPVLLMFRHILELLDSISILVKNSSIEPCKVLLRSILETSIQLEYLIESDLINKAHCFLFWNYLNELKVSKKLNPTTTEYQELLRKFQADKSLPSGSIPPAIQNLGSKTSNLESILNSSILASTKVKYESIIKSKGKVKSWYHLYDQSISNLEQLINELNRQAQYEVLYRYWSGAVHGTDIINGKLSSDEEGHAQIIQLRIVKDAQTITNYAITFGIQIFRFLGDKRVPKHKIEIAQWYMDNIKEAYFRLSTEQFILER